MTTHPQRQRDALKTRRAPNPTSVRKPAWIRVRHGGGADYRRVLEILDRQGLSTVCQEASCPNQGECYGSGTATFMILGNACTRRCPFCDVAHGRPAPPDEEEPRHLAEAVAELGLRHVVITSVDRDDLRDGGASHFAACVAAVRAASPQALVEILVPDFRGRHARALDALSAGLPDVFNHNMETVPRLYREVRPGADYGESLALLAEFHRRHPDIPTKSGLMAGLGEEDAEIRAVMADLRLAGVTLLTIGQYLQPSPAHLPVAAWVPPETFANWAETARAMGFSRVASAPLVRSSYHAAELVAAD